ncbi:cryptochrome/photolyase family protein [Poseidonocella sedimentorum]|uniref:Deoxyribodipyrimidine photo-lyase n=1 Tax=Poseidonocella sedimentorum TaxID=871652 RepID=A0A1I6DI39_9RHOB|nr:deoxyribodipyrimidine photo-lyase [Poseidonocella sedimentorum]SFR05104.1 deoxyribodipyrimidine photo-lyase [Poseidonocella sedimentorum]
MTDTPVLLWFRRDLRLSDHRALCAACETGHPIIPVFIHDGAVDALGAAATFRLGLGLADFANTLEARGSRLILRRGPAIGVLDEIIEETGAGAVFWSRLYDPRAQERDAEIKSALNGRGLEARSFPGHLLFEPWTVETGGGAPYRVYSPYWRNVRSRDPGEPLPAPKSLPAPAAWPRSDALGDWDMGAALRRGAEVLRPYIAPGEAAAQARLATFTEERIERYKADRNLPARAATSDLSEYLTLGEISPRQLWAAGLAAQERGAAGAEHFLKEVTWRDFAWHLGYHWPRLFTDNWREEWDDFPWDEDESRPEVIAWKQGRTGVLFVDAAMRELYVTGRMHNRARMIVASYLTKHLLAHWRIGQRWFEDCLIDWDPASNAMGWQWVAGSGPDAAPYFRIFNPETQREKFDPDEAYCRRWLAEPFEDPSAESLSYFDAAPRAWGLSPKAPYPAPVVGLKEGRERALAAYHRARD